MALALARARTAALRASAAPAKAVEAAGLSTPSVLTLCALAGVSRATAYAQQRAVVADATDLVLCQLIDGQYTHRPFYGTRRMAPFLESRGHTANRKRVRRLMRGMGLVGMAPGPNTGRPSTPPAHKIYPYLLRGVTITRPNQVWSTDINPAFAGAGSTSVSTTDSRIWWPSWIGTDAACCLGVSATAWMRRSA